MDRKILIPGAGALVAVLVLQLFQPTPPGQILPGDGPITDHVAVPDEVHALLRSACYDCHSDDTRWPWYAKIAPVSWLVARDVRHGRGNLDFSHWSIDPVREPTPSQRLRFICEDVRENAMPPPAYLLMHPEARLTDPERARICAWTERALGRRPDGGGGLPVR